MNAKSIMIFGTGKSSEIVENSLSLKNINLIAYLDNNRKKQGELYRGVRVIPPNDISKYKWDYIIIGSIHYKLITNQLESIGVPYEKIIPFFSDNFEPELYDGNLFSPDWKVEILKFKITSMEQEWERKFNLLINNLEYEVLDKARKKEYRFPIILSGEDALNKIINENYSMSRFGDGEFEIMALKQRPKFQLPNERLAKRLSEVLRSNLENHIVAIADNYGRLDQYDNEAAMAIREYMTRDVRDFHMNVLDLDKVYYDAYVSRPYVLYKDKSRSHDIFLLFKQIWDKKDIIIVEGDKTRIGVGNDLLSNAKSIKRIVAPSENAFDVYDNIFDSICKLSTKYLILIALGPTATVLAYDLVKKGYQAIDIGHIDIEYEWFLRGLNKRVDIPNKYVNEVTNGENAVDINDSEYSNQIINRIMN